MSYCFQGFAIGSAALVSLALFGAFVSRAGISTVDVLSPKVFIGLIVGAMLPYWFSAMTMKSVGSAALKMVEEVRRQFNTIPGLMEGTAKPDYATCVKISTDASIKEMIPPGALVMLTPLIVGTFFGVETLSGILAGSLVSGVQVMLKTTMEISKWLVAGVHLYSLRISRISFAKFFLEIVVEDANALHFHDTFICYTENDSRKFENIFLLLSP